MAIQRTEQLLDSGLTKYDLARENRRGGRVNVRHGAWSENAPTDELERHRQLIAGTWPLLGEAAVLSHGSAAVLHGLPVWRPLLERVSATRASGGHGGRSRYLHMRRAPLAPVEVTELDGYRVTSLERTALDLARSVSYERAVAILDAALHANADAGLLAEMADAGRYRTGAAVARRALAFADRRAESVGESISRVRMAELGLPAPDLQFNVFDRNGAWVARVDFVWPDCGVVGEFDGAIKYAGPPDEVAAAVMKEKARQQDIEAVGWLVVRWSWSDLGNRDQFRARISASLEKGRRLRERS